MKKLCFITILVFLVANLLLSQNIYQATRWAVQGYEIDFTSSSPTYSSLSTGTVSDCINSFTYTEGEMLFQIVDDRNKNTFWEFC